MAISAKDKAEIERKASLGKPLVGDRGGHVSSANLAYWQQLMTKNAAAAKQSSSSTVGGVGSKVVQPPPNIIYMPGPTPEPTYAPPPAAPTYPGNTILPQVTNDAVTGYGFTAIVGLGVAMLFMSLISSFRRVRGR